MVSQSTTLSPLLFYVNGKRIERKIHDVKPEMTLLTFLRNELALTGTKLGCAEGGCGACTVMLSHYDNKNHSIKHRSINACLMPICAVAHMHVTTVEGIGSIKNRVHPVQQRMANSHGSQCGFCTPGFVMSMYTLLRNNPSPTDEQIEHTFDGNLCRCTGYRPIIEGFKTFSSESKASSANGACGMGDKCCKVNGKGCGGDEIGETKHDLYDKSLFIPYDETQEPIFPPELIRIGREKVTTLNFQSDLVSWHRPSTLDEMLHLKQRFPAAKIVTGNTEVGIEVKFKKCEYPVIISGTHVPELNSISEIETGISIGACVTLTELVDKFKSLQKSQPASKVKTFTAALELLRWFAGNQIRNVAAIGGNIATASPISDLNPLWMASNAYIETLSLDGKRKVLIRDMFLGYRKIDLKHDEIILSIFVPFTEEFEFVQAYKQARRKDDDIAIVNSAIRMKIKSENGVHIVESCSLCFGGMAATSIAAPNTEKGIIGKKFDETLIEEACDSLGKELIMSGDAPGGMVRYRQSLALSFLYKFYIQISRELGVQLPAHISDAGTPLERGLTNGIQSYEHLNRHGLAVHDPKKHLAATKQSTGEAIYVDDMPKYNNEKYAGLVLSKKAHALVTHIDCDEAMKIDGVVGFVSAEDVPCNNIWGPIFKDEEVIPSDKVTAVGQIIGLVIAEDQFTAQKAANLVTVTYQDLPAVLTIEEAIEAKSFIGDVKTISYGDIEEGFEDCDLVFEGETRVGGQEHFYLETVACIAVPKEDDEMELFVSTQAPTKTQIVCASALGIPHNRVTCRVKRLGGGFGGKETRTVLLSTVCAIAARKFEYPIRCMFDRDEDMQIMGQRHPFLAKYKVGATKDGKVKAMDVQLYCNAGYSADLSTSVLERGLFHIDNCYKIPNLRVRGWCCRTNTVSNTAFRGFGGPQGLHISESIMFDVAHALGLPQEEVRYKNMYQTNDVTHYNQPLPECRIKRAWEQVLDSSDYQTRKLAIQEYNKKHLYRKRGIHATPTKFGISFTAKFLNQAGALVNIFQDGSVLVTHGGTEMGQGLHTKIAQIVASELQCPLENVYISETSTDKVPNTSPTAASASTDLNGGAVKDACDKLNERLKPYFNDELGERRDFSSSILKAYLDRISLSASGFYSTPDLGYSWETNTGNAFNYYTYGTAVSEVEIDCLTGDFCVLRTDIVMDVGSSINPAIDIGQIEGAFVQGLGLFTMEELLYSPEGRMRTIGPGAYKIPAMNDIPATFNVSLLKDAANKRAIYSSKAIGEPPLHLADSVFFAIKQAIHSSKCHQQSLSKTQIESSSHTETTIFRLDSPATSERIRMACDDHLTKRVPEATIPEGKKPWNIII